VQIGVRGALRCANTQHRDARTMRKGVKRLAPPVGRTNPKSSKANNRGLARGFVCFRKAQRKRMKSMLKTCTVGLVGFVAQIQPL
jgi:hypothetical protein